MFCCCWETSAFPINNFWFISLSVFSEPVSKPVPAKRKLPSDARKASLPESSSFQQPFHYENKEHCFTDTALSALNGIISKDSSESPEFENAATPFRETELRITDDFDHSQEDELLSPTTFSTGPNSVGVPSIIDVVTGFEKSCDRRESMNGDGFPPICSSEEYITGIDSELGAVGSAVADLLPCSYNAKNGSGSRSDDSALPSSADNSDGSNAMGLDAIINNRNSNPALENFSDSGEVLSSSVGPLLDNIPKVRRTNKFIDPDTAAASIPSISSPIKDATAVSDGVTLLLPSDDEENPIPPDLPPRTYKAPPLPPRNRSSEAPPLPPRAEKPHVSMQSSTHSVTPPTSPARSVESLDFVNIGPGPLEPPPLPPRTYSPVHMPGTERAGESESGGSVSLLSTEDSDSRSFDSMEAFSGSRESLQNDSGVRLGQDVLKREHKKLHRLSQGKCAKNSLSGGLMPSAGIGFGAECVENQRPKSPSNREWRRSAEILSVDRTDTNQSPPPVVYRHKQTKDSDRLQSVDSTLTDRHRSTSFDSPVDRLRSLNFSSSVEHTHPSSDRLRSLGNQDQTPPPVERPHPSESHGTHKRLNFSHSVPRSRHKDPPPLINDRSRSFDTPPTFDRQCSVDSIPVDRLRSQDLLNTQPNIEMPPSLPPFIDRHSSDSFGNIIVTSSGQLKDSQGQNIYSPVLELNPPIYSRQRSYETSRRPVERQHSNESSKSSSSGSMSQSGLTGALPSGKLPVRRSLSPAVRRITDSSSGDRSDMHGAVGGSVGPQWCFAGSAVDMGCPETPPRPGPLGSGRTSTPSPPVIYPRGRILSEEERQQNRQNIHQHLQKWTQKQKERANSSFGSSDAGDFELSSPSSETRSLLNGHCSWVTFDDTQPHSHGTVTGDSSLPESMETVLGVEGGSSLPGQGAILPTGGRLSPQSSSSVIWQLRHEGEHEPPPSIDSGELIYVFR